jgi:hypothetical protein
MASDPHKNSRLQDFLLIFKLAMCENLGHDRQDPKLYFYRALEVTDVFTCPESSRGRTVYSPPLGVQHWAGLRVRCSTISALKHKKLGGISSHHPATHRASGGQSSA